MAITINDWLTENAPQISTNINQKVMAAPTPWITQYRQEYWEDEKSRVKKTFQFDRAMVAGGADEVDWANMTAAVTFNDTHANHQAGGDGVSDGHIPPSDNIVFGQTLREYNLQWKSIWGPYMNVETMRDKFVRAQQMGACVKALADQGREYWIDRKRSEYKRVAGNLVVLDSSFALSGLDDYNKTAFRAYSGTDASMLTNGFLDEIYEYLNHQGAGGDALGSANAGSVYSLITSPRQSRRLIMADPDVREDFRYSSQNEKLLGSMKTKWAYNGWAHSLDETVERWEWYPTGGTPTLAITETTGAYVLNAALGGVAGANVYSTNAAQLTKGSTIIRAGVTYIVKSTSSATEGVLVRQDGAAVGAGLTASNAFTAWLKVPRFIYSGTGAALKRTPNPKWLIATWEDSYVFHQGVCVSEVPKPITSVGQASFAATNYVGTPIWKMYETKDQNPLGNMGQFLMVMANGTRPENPEYGIVIRHLAIPRPDSRIMGEDSLG
jgi:hypothetical protein